MTRPQLSIEGSTLAVTAAVVNALSKFKGSAPNEVASIHRHKGRFSTPDAVKKEVTNFGSIRIAALKITDVRREAGSMVGRVSLVAFVMTTDHFGHHKDERAEVIATRVALFISGLNWTKEMGRTAYTKAQKVDAQNLCTESLDNIGVAIWSVSWSQDCCLNVPVDLTGMDDFLQVQLDTPNDKSNAFLSGSISLRSDEKETR